MIKEKIVYLDSLETKYEKKINQLLKDSKLKFISVVDASKYCAELKCKYTTLYCEDYPIEFKFLPKPPLVIYYYGDINLINSRKLSIIGSRNNTLYGEKTLQKVISNIKGYTIVSGYARGIDQLAHKTSIIQGLSTIAILGGGIDEVYPKNDFALFSEIKKNHLVMSEYPPMKEAKPWQFLMRNRLIAALGEKILVIEANVKSGSLSTVEVALELSKEVYVMPGSVFSKQSKGCNLLIEEGASVLSIEQKFQG